MRCPKTLLIMVSIFCFISCSNSQNKTKPALHVGGTESDMASIINQKVNSFRERPYYSVDFDNSNSGCQFEILVNDVPVAKKIGINGAITSSAPINSCILRSGKQKLIIKVYPNVGKRFITTSVDHTTPLLLSVSHRRDAWNNKDMRDVIVFKMPEIKLPESGVAYIEREFAFEAKVPYQFEGWAGSKDLTKVPDIEQKVRNKYSEIRALLEHRDYVAFAKMKMRKDVEMNTSFFLRPDEIREGDDFERTAFTEKNAKVLPFDKVKVTFYGDGKLVTLENIADKSSALRTKIKYLSSDGKVKQEIIKFPILLHIPPNSDKLEIIR